MSRIHLVTGDTRPQIYVQLRQPDAVLDVSTASVVLKFRPRGGSQVLFQLNGQLLPGTLQVDLVQADLSQYPIPGSGGRVLFSFIDGNLSLPPGYYEGEIEIDFGPGNVFTPYNRLQFLLREEFCMLASRDIVAVVQGSGLETLVYVDFHAPARPADFVTIYDDVVIGVISVFNLADAVVMSDALFAAVPIVLPLADTVTMSDALVTQAPVLLPVADAVAMSDVLFAALPLSLPVADSVLMDETLSTTALANLQLADSVLMDETLTPSLGAGGTTYNLPLADSVTMSDTPALSSSTVNVTYLLLGGGGGGGSAGAGGGGGGGGYQAGVLAVGPGAFNVVVGAGGAGAAAGAVNGIDGGWSSFSSVAAMGGAGGSGKTKANDDGCGAGGSTNGATGSVGLQGRNGGNASGSGGGGGGGTTGLGVNGVSTNGGAGGAGTSNSISGAAVTYGGGGGGSGSGSGGAAGAGGGGSGATGATAATAGTDGLGGGGGAGTATLVSQRGGSGVVILSYPTGAFIQAPTGGTITTSGGNTIHTFTASGMFNVGGSLAPLALGDSVTMSDAAKVSPFAILIGTRSIGVSTVGQALLFPAGTSPGDLCLVLVSDGSAATSMAVSWNRLLITWTNITAWSSIYWKVLTAGDLAGTNVTNTSGHFSMVIAIYWGATSVAMQSFDAGQGAIATSTLTGFTKSSVSKGVCSYCSDRDNTSNATIPAPFSNRVTTNTAQFSGQFADLTSGLPSSYTDGSNVVWSGFIATQDQVSWLLELT